MPALWLASSAGRLEALDDPPVGDPPAHGPRAAVVCHPHPQHGGTLHNKVVHTVARTLASRGLHVLRFNFRGVGKSEGSYGETVGERDDVRAALGHAATLGAPLLLAGFSFGAAVGGTVALGDARVAALLLVAPPVNHYDFAPLAAFARPLGVIYGSADELVPAAEVEAWIATCRPAPWVARIGGAGHLFHAYLPPLRAAVAAFHERSASGAR